MIKLMNKIDFIEELFESEIYCASRFNRHSKEFTKILNSLIETRKELEALPKASASAQAV